MGSKYSLLEKRSVKWGLTLGLCAGLLSVLSFNPDNNQQLARLNSGTIDLAQEAAPSPSSGPATLAFKNADESFTIGSENLKCSPKVVDGKPTRSYTFTGCSDKPEHKGLCGNSVHDRSSYPAANALKDCLDAIAVIAKKEVPTNTPTQGAAPVGTAFDSSLVALEAAKPCKDKDAKDEKLECLTEAAVTLVTSLESNAKLKDSERREAFDKFHKNSLKRSIAECMSVRGQQSSRGAYTCNSGRYRSRLDDDRVGSCDQETVQEAQATLTELNLKITRSMHEQLMQIEAKKPIVEMELATAMYDCGKKTDNIYLQNLGLNRALNLRKSLNCLVPPSDNWILDNCPRVTNIYEQYSSLMDDQLDYEDRRDLSFSRSLRSSLDRFYGNQVEDFSATFDSNIGDLSQLMSMDKYYTNDLSESPWSIYQARSSSGLRGITPSEILARYSNTVVKEPTFIPVYSGSATPLYESESTRSRNPRVSGRIRE